MNKWKIVLILALAQFVIVLDSTVMNVSISTVVSDLGTTVNAMQTAITFFTLTMAAFMLIAAKLCAKWGLTRAFVIGSIIYGIGSLITGLSQNITQLFLGWSVVEGIGGVLVILAIAALIAANYKGKDRVTAFAAIGGVSGAVAAAGPLIGGYVTTYLSWRYVFFAEVVIMVFVLLFARSFKASKVDSNEPIDIPSAVLSSVGMALVVFGMLQSKVWGLIMPMDKPVINGHDVAPFGISIVAYLILIGVIFLRLFLTRQQKLEVARTSVASSDLAPSTKAYISVNVQSAQIVPSNQVESTATSKGATNAEAQQLAGIYGSEQLNGLREAAFFLIVLSLLQLPFRGTSQINLLPQKPKVASFE